MAGIIQQEMNRNTKSSIVQIFNERLNRAGLLSADTPLTTCLFGQYLTVNYTFEMLQIYQVS